MLKSMRSRMTLQFVMLLVPFLLATSYMVVMLTTKAAEDKSHEALNQLRDRVMTAMKDPDWQNKLQGLAAAPSFRQNQVGIIVRDRDDKVVLRSYASPPPIEFTPEMRDKWRFTGGRYKLYRVGVVQPKKPNDSNLPQTLFGLSVIVIGAVAGGAWFMVGKVLSPIRSLARQTSQASAEHLSVRLESPSKDVEMRDLVDTLNGLLDRVYETAEMKGRFYAAASHELRTPLQALSGHLELASSRKRTAEEYEEVVKESYKQTRRLISLVQGLLFLHQIDTNTHSSQGPVNLSESCESALEMMYPLMVSRNLKLVESFEPNVQILAVPSHAEVLARNLIENAVKYATEGGELKIVLRVEDNQILLEVTNDFPDSVKIATENVFEAFYRDDTSRNSKTGGNGLGLAICRAVSNANGWDVKLHQEGGKIRATVNFGPKDVAKDSKPKKRAASSLGKPATA
jgi:signal transduction histidine kinase